LLREIVLSMRPHQWYKNLVVFIAIVFSYNLFNLEMWERSILAFVAFCLISGSVYIINDIKDVEKDRLHPKKMSRPIAAGALSTRTALLIAILLSALSLSASFLVSRPLGYIELIYLF